ncbi:MAG: diaminopimelate decarboxylase [Candidatus Nitrospinota bacterium M3_3B_026]
MDPIRLFAADKGSLEVGGFPIGEIARKLKTPFYIYDAAIMRLQYEKLKAALPEGVHIHYSLKANPNVSVARVFRLMGAGAEAASAHELKTALAAGFPAGRIVFAGPGKSEDELRLAVRERIGSINVESAAELDRVLSLAGRLKKTRASGPVRISFRVNLDALPGAKGEIMTGGARKFGVDAAQLAPLARRAVDSGVVDFAGFHFFAGTQITSAGTLAAAHRRFAAWAKGFAEDMRIPVKSLNFGGGLGIPFRDSEPELDVKKLGRSLAEIRKDLSGSAFFKDTRFLVEPGRYLVGPSGIYVTRVTDVKTSMGRRYVITDGGVHHALIPIVLNKNYPSAILNKMDRRRTAEVTVAGPLCASADQFSRNLRLPEPEVGDLLGVFNSGAYGYTAGMVYFLSHPAPAEAMTDKGSLYLIRKRRKPERGIMTKINLQ